MSARQEGQSTSLQPSSSGKPLDHRVVELSDEEGVRDEEEARELVREMDES